LFCLQGVFAARPGRSRRAPHPREARQKDLFQEDNLRDGDYLLPFGGQTDAHRTFTAKNLTSFFGNKSVAETGMSLA
jgi:hypothetical protein